MVNRDIRRKISRWNKKKNKKKKKKREKKFFFKLKWKIIKEEEDRYFNSTIKFTLPYGSFPWESGFRRREKRRKGGREKRADKGAHLSFSRLMPNSRRVPRRSKEGTRITVVDFQILSEDKNGVKSKSPDKSVHDRLESVKKRKREREREEEEEEEKWESERMNERTSERANE